MPRSKKGSKVNQGERRAVLLGRLFVSLLLLCTLQTDLYAAGRPNIVLVIADDLGWPYLGFMGHPLIVTPTIDSLATAGVVFETGYVTASVCRPSLSTLLSGLTPHQWSRRVAEVSQQQTQPIPWYDEVLYFNTLARVLENVGYKTFQGGKYWEGTAWMGGFSAGTKSEIGSSVAEWSGGVEFGRSGIDSLREFLDGLSGAPFFAWYAPMIPHGPFDAAEAYHAPYQGLGLRNRTIDYYANVTWLDDVVGELLEELQIRNLRNDTLIVFLSDNGREDDPDHPDALGWLLGEARGKLSMYELGFRTPVIFNWPGVISSQSRSELVELNDVFQTIVDYAETQPPADTRGQSLRDTIETGAAFTDGPIFGEMLSLRNPDWTAGEPYQSEERATFVRTDEWRFIDYEQRGYSQLFNITVDPFEDVDILESNPEIGTALQSEIANWEAARSISPGPYDITGTVVEAGNGDIPEGVGGVDIRVRGRTEDGRKIRADTRTSESGFFRAGSLPAGEYKLIPKSRGMRFHNANGGTIRKLEITLPAGLSSVHVPSIYAELRTGAEAPAGFGQIRGRIQTSTGAGVPYARVVLRDTNGRRIRIKKQTQSNGEFVFEGLPAGSYILRVRVPRPYRLQNRRYDLSLADSRDFIDLEITTNPQE